MHTENKAIIIKSIPVNNKKPNLPPEKLNLEPKELKELINFLKSTSGSSCLNILNIFATKTFTIINFLSILDYYIDSYVVNIIIISFKQLLRF